MAGQEKWYFTRDQLLNSPSRKCGLDADKELAYRQQAANLIQDMGQRLHVSQLCINTAIVYMHRFYAFHSFTHFHRNAMAAAALFLAAKMEEQPRKLEHVIKVAHICLHRGETSQQVLDVRSDHYQEQSQDLVFNENVLLQTLGFDVAIDHPHTHVVKTCSLIRASKDLAQTSYFMASNSLHLTTMCLQYRPTVVACFCIHLASKWSNWEIPQSNEGKHWFNYVDRSVTAELLEHLTSEFLHIFDRCPSRLKKKIMSIPNSQGTGSPSQHQGSSSHGAGPSIASSPFDKEPRKIPPEEMEKVELDKRQLGLFGPPTSSGPNKVDYREYRERQQALERRRAGALVPPSGAPPVPQPSSSRPGHRWPHPSASRDPNNPREQQIRDPNAQRERESSMRDPSGSHSREPNVRDREARDQNNIRDPNMRELRGDVNMMRDPNALRDPSRESRDPSRESRDPSRESRDPSRESRDPALRESMRESSSSHIPHGPSGDSIRSHADVRVHERREMARDPSRDPSMRESGIRDPSSLINRERENNSSNSNIRESNRDPSLGIRDPSTGIRDPSTAIRDPSTGIRDPSTGIRDPSMRDPSLRDPAQLMASSQSRSMGREPGVRPHGSQVPRSSHHRSSIQPDMRHSSNSMQGLPPEPRPRSSQQPPVPSQQPQLPQQPSSMLQQPAQQRVPPPQPNQNSTSQHPPPPHRPPSLFSPPEPQQRKPSRPPSIQPQPSTILPMIKREPIPAPLSPFSSPGESDTKPELDSKFNVKMDDPDPVVVAQQINSQPVSVQQQPGMPVNLETDPNMVSNLLKEAIPHRSEKKKKKEKHKHKDRDKKDERKKHKKNKDKKRESEKGGSSNNNSLLQPVVSNSSSTSTTPIKITIPREAISNVPLNSPTPIADANPTRLKIKIPKDRLRTEPPMPAMPSHSQQSQQPPPALKIKIPKEVVEGASRKRPMPNQAGDAPPSKSSRTQQQAQQLAQQKALHIMGNGQSYHK